MHSDTHIQKRRGALVILAILAALIVGGCASSPKIPAITESDTFPHVGPTHEVRLEPGDSIEIRLHEWPDLGDVQVIRPDGTISLAPIDEDIRAAGLTPTELDRVLTEKYKKVVKDPQVAIILRGLISQRFFVSGQVNLPGQFELFGPTTVLQALSTAGGMDTRTAKPENIVLVRHMNGKRYAVIVNLKEAFKEDGVEQIFLAPRDIVYVPKKRIVAVNEFVDLYINRLLPEGLTYSHIFADGRNIAGYTPPGLGAGF